MTTSAERYGDAFAGERMWGLKELPYPDPVSLAPETMGWAVLALFLLLGVAWLAWRARRRWLADAYRRDALQMLAGMSADRSRELVVILRRAALAAAGRSTVAPLHGEAWIGWLNASSPRPLFKPGDARLLDQLTYANQLPPEPEIQRLVSAGRQWLREHHV